MPDPSWAREGAPSPGVSWVRVGFGFGIGVLLAYGLAQAFLGAEQVLVLALLSLFLAVSLEPAVAVRVRVGVRRGFAVAAVVLAVVAVAAGFVALAVPPVTTEINALVQAVPVWIKELRDHHSTLGRLEDRYHLLEKVEQHFSGGDAASALFSGVLGMGQKLVGALAGLLAVSTLTIYLLTGMPLIKRFALRFVRAPRRQAVGDLTDRIMTQVGRWAVMSMASGSDDARRRAERLQEQIAEDRRELVRTIAALHEKTNVKKRVRERASGAEIAAADLASRAGRTAGVVPRFVRWAAGSVSDQAQKAPKPVRAPIGKVIGVVRQRLRLLLALWTAVMAFVAVLAMRRWRRG